jgi:hypothetical protein
VKKYYTNIKNIKYKSKSIEHFYKDTFSSNFDEANFNKFIFNYYFNFENNKIQIINPNEQLKINIDDEIKISLDEIQFDKIIDSDSDTLNKSTNQDILVNMTLLSIYYSTNNDHDNKDKFKKIVKELYCINRYYYYNDDFMMFYRNINTYILEKIIGFIYYPIRLALYEKKRIDEGINNINEKIEKIKEKIKSYTNIYDKIENYIDDSTIEVNVIIKDNPGPQIWGENDTNKEDIEIKYNGTDYTLSKLGYIIYKLYTKDIDYYNKYETRS